MDGTILYILIAAVAGLFAWGVICLIQGVTDGERKKLSERLGSDDRIDAANATRQSIVIQQMESGGLPPGMARNRMLQSLHGRLIQAYPDLRLSKFLLF